MSYLESINTEERMQEFNYEIEQIRQETEERIAASRKKFERETTYLKKISKFNSGLLQALSEEEHEIKNDLGVCVRDQRNLVITAQTQVGKTKTLIKVLQNAIPFTISVVSCDNRADQLKQLSLRMNENNVVNFLVGSIDVKKKQISRSDLAILKSYYDEHRTLTFVLLNNSAQVSKLASIINHLMNTIEIVKYQVIHDEADLIHKSDNAETNGPELVAKVHKAWVSHFNDIKIYKMIRYMKRIWVSATPENCSLIKNVKAGDVFVLPSNEIYQKQNKFCEWKDTDTAALMVEVNRIKGECSKEVILYCTERLNDFQKEKSLELLRLADCPVVSYNGTGNTIFKPNQRVIHNKSDSISSILAILESNYSGPVIVVGHALMSRGISFVSSRPGDKPLSATVMFYEGSKTTHAVNIAQRIGRITGNSRPDITDRRLYCSKPIHDCYKNYLSNQQAIYKALEKPENKERFVADVLKDVIPGLVGLGRKLERKELKKTNNVYETTCINSSENTGVSNPDDESKMQRLVKSWIKESNKTDIAKVFRKIYSSPGKKMLSSEVKKNFNTHGPYIAMTDLNHESSSWYTVFSKDNTHHYIKPEALAFARTL